MPDLEGLLQRLVTHRVRFVVVGGFAAVAHGCTMLTQDIDICAELSYDNLKRLAEALAGLHPVHRMTPQRLPLVVTVDFCKGLRNLYLATDLGQLDCLGEVKGIGGFDEVMHVSDEVELHGGACHVLALDALIRAKRAMGRPRDREAILQLETIRELRGLAASTPPQP